MLFIFAGPPSRGSSLLRKLWSAGATRLRPARPPTPGRGTTRQRAARPPAAPGTGRRRSAHSAAAPGTTRGRPTGSVAAVGTGAGCANVEPVPAAAAGGTTAIANRSGYRQSFTSGEVITLMSSFLYIIVVTPTWSVLTYARVRSCKGIWRLKWTVTWDGFLLGPFHPI